MTISLIRGVRSTPIEVCPITPDMAGCWFAGASNRTADELNAAVTLCAWSYGWEDAIEYSWDVQNVEGWAEDWDDEHDHSLTEIANDAADYLNTLAPEGYHFEFDEGFYLYRDEEEILAW